MTLEQFRTKYKLGKSYDFEGGYKGECVSLVKNYIKEVLGVKVEAIGNAKEYALKYDKCDYLNKNFVKVDNSKIKAGDIWVRKTGTYGHIGIALSVKDGVVTTLEQNHGGNRIVTNEKLKLTSDYVVLRQKPFEVEPKKETVSYYKKCDSKHKSIVDALDSIKVDSSFANRKKIAGKNNMAAYSGSVAQNEKLLALLKAGKLKK